MNKAIKWNATMPTAERPRRLCLSALFPPPMADIKELNIVYQKKKLIIEKWLVYRFISTDLETPK